MGPVPIGGRSGEKVKRIMAPWRVLCTVRLDGLQSMSAVSIALAEIQRSRCNKMKIKP